MRYVLTTYEKINNFTKMDAYAWAVESGYKAEELTAEDILAEYNLEEFFPYEEEPEPNEYYNEFAFSTEEVAEMTLKKIAEYNELEREK